MKTYQLITDSTSDLTQAQLDAAELACINFEYVIGDQTYENDPLYTQLSNKAFYDEIRQGALPTTNQINLHRYQEFFEQYLREGLDVLYLGFSGGLSGSFNNSVMAAEELRHKYPERKILCVDTVCAAAGQGLLVLLAAKKWQAGEPIEAVRDWVEQKKTCLNELFTVNDLNHLKRGGRISPALAFAGSMLNIKPCLLIDRTGHLENVAKIRGRKKAMEWIVEQMQAQCDGAPEDQQVFVVHADCPEDGQTLLQMIQQVYPKLELHLMDLGPVIGAHTGPGLVAVTFLGKERTQ